METTEKITGLIRDQYNLLDEANQVMVSPSLLAGMAYEQLDPASTSPMEVRYLALLALKQIARQVCADRIEDDERNVDQGTLFEMQLQPRYPTDRGGEKVYVLRQHLTLAERRANVNRLRSEATAKLQHAKALEAETNDLIQRGVLTDRVAA